MLDLKRGTIPDVVVNSLYKYTPLESSYGINMLAVVDNKPQLLNLKSALTCFLEHRREVVIRRTRFDLDKAKLRAHIVEGLLKALDVIDDIVALIKASPTPLDARNGLMERFGFSDIQAQSILDMRLQRLTGLERDKLQDEFAELSVLLPTIRPFWRIPPCCAACCATKPTKSRQPMLHPDARKFSWTSWGA